MCIKRFDETSMFENIQRFLFGEVVYRFVVKLNFLLLKRWGGGRRQENGGHLDRQGYEVGLAGEGRV